jgi:hypothetical protein
MKIKMKIKKIKMLRRIKTKEAKKISLYDFNKITLLCKQRIKQSKNL